MMSRWTSAKCWACGWEAPRMELQKAKAGICPHCHKKELHPM